jgi:exonuclease SbcD
MSIRVLHFADLHIGMENYGKIDPTSGISSRIRDFLERLDEVLAHAREQQADLIVFAGDAFKTRDPDTTQQREFATRIKQLAEVAPVLLLVGNHDVPGIAARATSVDIFSTLDVPNVIVGRRPDARVVQTRQGPVFLAWMPFPVRNRLLAGDETLQGASIDELDRAVERLVVSRLESFAQEAEGQGMPRLLAGHFSVSEAKLGSERSVMVGRDLIIPKSALDHPAWDYVALGHIHKHQALGDDGRREVGDWASGLPAIVYSGSLERIDFGEERETKGFCWVELERGATRWQFVPVGARPFRTLKIDARGAEDSTAAAIAKIGEADVSDAVVRMLVTLDEGQEALFRRREVERALAEAGASVVAGVAIEVQRSVRVPGVGGNAEALTPDQWLERYFIARNRPPERVDDLMKAAREIFDEPLS